MNKKGYRGGEIELGKKEFEDLRTAFNLFDTEGTGTISVSELKVALRALGFEPKSDEVKKLLNDCAGETSRDPKNPGSLDFSEFVNIMKRKMNEAETEEEILKAYSLFSENESNGITFESLKAIAAEIEENVSEEELLEMVNEATHDKSDAVTLEQFRSIIELNPNEK